MFGVFNEIFFLKEMELFELTEWSTVIQFSMLDLNVNDLVDFVINAIVRNWIGRFS